MLISSRKEIMSWVQIFQELMLELGKPLKLPRVDDFPF